jgi:DNA topoisomerase-2
MLQLLSLSNNYIDPLQLGFAWHLRTHVVKATKGSNTRPFFTERQFKEWEQSGESGGGWRIKFYKGMLL